MKETRYLISETAKLVQVEPHVLRYWEEELGLSIKRNEMGHRYYTDKDLEIFQKIKELKKEGLQLKTIKEKLHEKDGIPQVEEHRISGEGITKQQKTEPEFQEEQIQVKIVTPRKFLTEQSFEKKAEKQKRKTKSTNIEKRICLCYSVMEYISLGRGGQYESINIIGRFEIYLLSGQHRTGSLYSCI